MWRGGQSGSGGAWPSEPRSSTYRGAPPTADGYSGGGGTRRPPSPRSKLRQELDEFERSISGYQDTQSSSSYGQGQGKGVVHEYGHKGNSVGGGGRYGAEASRGYGGQREGGSAYGGRYGDEKDSGDQRYGAGDRGRHSWTKPQAEQKKENLSGYPDNIKGYMDFVRQQREEAGIDKISATQIPGIGESQDALRSSSGWRDAREKGGMNRKGNQTQKDRGKYADNTQTEDMEISSGEDDARERKEGDSKNPVTYSDFTEPWQYCDLCGIHFAERKHYMVHCGGMLHTRRVLEKNSGGESREESANDQQKEEGGHKESLAGSSATQEKGPLARDKTYNKDLFPCTLCDTTCTNKSNLVDHNKGFRHCKRYLQRYTEMGSMHFFKKYGKDFPFGMEDPREKPPTTPGLLFVYRSGLLNKFECRICRTKCFSSAKWKEHCLSMEHSKNVMKEMNTKGMEKFVSLFGDLPGITDEANQEHEAALAEEEAKRAAKFSPKEKYVEVKFGNHPIPEAFDAGFDNRRGGYKGPDRSQAPRPVPKPSSVQRLMDLPESDYCQSQRGWQQQQQQPQQQGGFPPAGSLRPQVGLLDSLLPLRSVVEMSHGSDSWGQGSGRDRGQLPLSQGRKGLLDNRPYPGQDSRQSHTQGLLHGGFPPGNMASQSRYDDDIMDRELQRAKEAQQVARMRLMKEREERKLELQKLEQEKREIEQEHLRLEREREAAKRERIRQEKERELQLAKELERELENERQREMERKREIERQKQELERKRKEMERMREMERQAELERQQAIARQKEQDRQRELQRQREQERQRELQRQKELERQREAERLKKIEREKELAKQKELEQKRELERKKQMEERKKEQERLKQEQARKEEFERDRTRRRQNEQSMEDERKVRPRSPVRTRSPMGRDSGDQRSRKSRWSDPQPERRQAPPQPGNIKVDEALNMFNNTLQRYLGNIPSRGMDEEQAGPSEGRPDDLSEDEQLQVLQVQQMTGINDVGKVRMALKVLRQMDPRVVQTLGAMDPDSIRNLTTGDPGKEGSGLIQQLLNMLQQGRGEEEGPPPPQRLPERPMMELPRPPMMMMPMPPTSMPMVEPPVFMPGRIQPPVPGVPMGVAAQPGLLGAPVLAPVTLGPRLPPQPRLRYMHHR